MKADLDEATWIFSPGSPEGSGRKFLHENQEKVKNLTKPNPLGGVWGARKFDFPSTVLELAELYGNKPGFLAGLLGSEFVLGGIS